MNGMRRMRGSELDNKGLVPLPPPARSTAPFPANLLKPEDATRADGVGVNGLPLISGREGAVKEDETAVAAVAADAEEGFVEKEGGIRNRRVVGIRRKDGAGRRRRRVAGSYGEGVKRESSSRLDDDDEKRCGCVVA